MAIQDEMYNMIVRKINKTIAEDNQKVIVDYNKAKEVAKMLASLSTEPNTAESLVNEYIKSIDNRYRSGEVTLVHVYYFGRIVGVTRVGVSGVV